MSEKLVKPEACFLMLVKGKEKYLFKYFPGDETNLFYILLDMGRSEDYSISLVEVFQLIRKISNHLKKHGIGESMKFEWPLTNDESSA